jgi:outer membrane protein assembly factor BamB
MSGSFVALPVREFRGELWRSRALPHPGRSFIASGAVALMTDEVGLCAVNTVTGRLRWTWRSDRPSWPPAAAAGRVFVANSAALTAIEIGSGHRLWRRQLATNNRRQQAGFPVVAVAQEDTVYLTEPDAVWALDATTGRLRWQAPVDDPEAGLAMSNGAVFVVDRIGVLNALSATNGRALWHRQVAQSPAVPAVAGGVVMVGYGGLVALDVRTGDSLWHMDSELETTRVALDGTTAYVAASDRLLAVDARTGEVRWDYVNPAKTSLTVGPSVAGSVVYVADAAGDLFAIDSSDHAQLWSYQALLRPGQPNIHHNPAPTRRREFGGGPLVVANGVVLVSDVSGTVYAVG